MSLAAGQIAAIALYVLTAGLLLAAELFRSPRRSRMAAWASLPAGAAAIAAFVVSSPVGKPYEPYLAPAERTGRQLTVLLGGGGGHRLVARRTGDGSQAAAHVADTGGSDAGGGAGASWFEDAAAARPGPLDVVRDCADCPEMVIVPAGDAAIGAAPADAEATSAEHPRTLVRFWPGFAIARFEITVEQYARFASATGRPAPACGTASGWSRDAGAEEAGRLPVTCISSADAHAYAAWLKARTGKPFRLPSAAEWEYAARAGASSAAVAFPHASQPLLARAHLAQRLQPAGAGMPNAWGIFAMPGNAAEHVADCWHDTLELAPPTGRAYLPHAA